MLIEYDLRTFIEIRTCELKLGVMFKELGISISGDDKYLIISHNNGLFAFSIEEYFNSQTLIKL